MANINPPAGWNDIPQLETTTIARGGVGGPMNAQAEALAARTNLLKQQIDSLPGEVDAAGTAATLIAQHNNEALAHPQLSAFITSEADRAETAADAAAINGNVYATKALGLAGTPSGQYFNVISGSAGNYIDLYLNNAGVAVLKKTYPSSVALDNWQRKYPGLFFVNPYYEDAGNALYFKPTEYQTSGLYIYIRGGYLADAAFNYDKLKNDLIASGIPTSCEVGVTSPLGVPDCIKLGGITTMWYEPVSQAFSWGARAPKSYYLKFLEYNASGVAKCEELPNVVDSKHKTNMVKVDSKIPCQIIPSSSVAPYIPNIDVAAKTLTFYADTLIEAGWTRHSISTTTSVDLSVIASSALIIYYDKATLSFVVKAWNYVLSEVERYNYVLVATLRIGATYATTSMSIACPYTVNGKMAAAETPLSQPVARIFTPKTGATAADPKLPEYTTATRTLTLYQDTILQTRDLEWVLESTQSINVGSASSATRVWWNTATSVLETSAWNSTQTSQQILDRVLVADIRHTTAGTAVLSIACPYTVNGKLFGVNQDAGSIIHNPLDANIKGIMHRGYSSLAPQNTLPAYKKAAELYNYYVEGDIRWTLDEVPVLLHDETIDATSDGTGAIATMTFAEARAYDFGSWFSPVYVGTPIPSFEEILKSMKKLGLHGFFELKTVVSTAQINALMTLLNRTGMFGRIQFDCFFYTVLQEVVSIKPSQNVGLLGSLSSAFIDQCVTLKSGQNKVTAAVAYASVTAELVQEANEKGISVVVWTVDSAADVIAAADKGVDGIMTNSLNIAQVLRENELG